MRLTGTGRCAICCNSWTSPIRGAYCSHIFCRSCLLANMQDKGEETCPTCHASMARETLQAFVGYGAMGNDVQCIHACGWKGPRGHLADHTASCPVVQVNALKVRALEAESALQSTEQEVQRLRKVNQELEERLSEAQTRLVAKDNAVTVPMLLECATSEADKASGKRSLGPGSGSGRVLRFALAGTKGKVVEAVMAVRFPSDQGDADSAFNPEKVSDRALSPSLPLVAWIASVAVVSDFCRSRGQTGRLQALEKLLEVVESRWEPCCSSAAACFEEERWNIESAADVACYVCQQGVDHAIDAAIATLTGHHSSVGHVAAKVLWTIAAEPRTEQVEQAVVRWLPSTASPTLSGLLTMGMEGAMARSHKYAVQCVIRHLGHDDEGVRRSAAKALSQLARGNEQILEVLSARLAHPHAHMRASAVEALAQVANVGDDEILTKVAACLEDPDVTVKNRALEAISDLATPGDKRAITIAVGCLDRPAYFSKTTALRALAQAASHGDELILCQIAKSLEDKDDIVRMEAAKALAKVSSLGDKRALTALSSMEFYTL